MPNVSRISGFKPVKHQNGSPYNGQATIYYVPTGSNIFVGDAVKLAADGTADGIPQVAALAAGSAGTGQAGVGVVVGVITAKMDPVTGKMTAGSISLDTPQYVATGVGGFVLVADATDLIYEVEATSAGSSYSFAATDIGQNANIVATAGSTTTGNSNHALDMADKGTTATLPFKIVGVSRKVDNDATGAFTKVLVTLNNHQFKSTGTAGV